MGLSNVRGKRLQLMLALTGALAFVLQGYDQALMNGLLNLPSFSATFPALDTSTPALAEENSTLQGTVVALYEVGAALGALSCYIVNSRYGRKRTTMGAAACVLIGGVLQASSFSVPQLTVARIVTGLGVGSFTATIPTWVGESSEADARGRLVIMEGSGAIFGVMFISWLSLGFYFTGNNAVSWRFPISLQLIFPIAVLLLIPSLEESPRWLMAKDRFEDAAQVLGRLEDEDPRSENIAARLQVIERTLQLEQTGHSSNPFAITPNKYRLRCFVAIATNIFGQMCGINVPTFYSNEIFEGVLGFDPVLSRVTGSCLQTLQFFAALAAILLIDRYGRRRLLLIGAAALCIGQAGLAGLQAHPDNRTAIACSFIFYAILYICFPISLFVLPFLYASEIAPLRIRSQVTALSGASNWLFNFLIAEVTPVAFNNISWRYYLVYVCTNLLAFIFFYLFVPETKGRSLEDIDAFFIGAKNVLDPVKIAKLTPPGVAEDYDLSRKADFQGRHVENTAEEASG